MSSNRVVCKRWLDVLAYALITALVAVGFRPQVIFLQRAVERSLQYVSNVLILAGLLLSSALLLWWASCGRRPGYLSLRYAHGYPPLIISAVLATLLIALGDVVVVATSDGVQERMIVTGSLEAAALVWVLVLPAVLVATLRSRTKGGRAIKPPPVASSLHLLENAAELKRWVQKDEPVANPSEDLLGHDRIARRMAQRLLTAASSGEAPCIGVLGRRGSGKTSLLNLIEYHLSQADSVIRRRIRITRVHTWGFTSPEAGLRHILCQIVNAIAGDLDATALLGLPDNVVAAMTATIPETAGIAKLLPRGSDPDTALARISEMLSAIDACIIVCIEDIDRNPGDTFNARHCEALLDRLRRVPRIGSILTVEPRRARTSFDYAKLCQFEESLPELDPYVVRRVIRTFESSAYSGRNLINPVELLPEVRSKRGGETSPEHDETVFRVLRSLHGGKSFEDALLAVATTPRGLKDTLRRAFAVWEQMPGEIDFTHLVIASAVRAELPRVWAFVRNNEAALINSDRARRDRADDWEKNLTAELHEACEADGVDAWAVEELLGALFSRAPGLVKLSDRVLTLQGMTDEDGFYWRRFLAGELDSDQVSDQRVLRAIRDHEGTQADKGNSELVKSYAADSGFRSKFKQFQRCLPSAELLPLLSAALEAFRATHNGKELINDDLSASLMRVLGTYGGETAAVRDWIVSEFEKAGERNLQHAYNLCHACASQYGPLPPDERAVVRERVGAWVDARFRDKPELLAQATQPASPFIWGWLLFSTADHGLPHATPAAWRGFGDTIVAAVPLNAQFLYPSLIRLLGRVAQELDEYFQDEDGVTCRACRYELDTNIVAELFTDHDQLREAIVNGDPALITRPDLRRFAQELKATPPV